jgi:prepilin-type N-terminal cleavage/methylation domain-containing protein
MFQDQKGFTLIELMIVIVVVAVLFATFGVFFNNTLISFLDQQQNSVELTQLQVESTRLGDVIRGATGIVNASNNNLELYSYFNLSDQYVSLVDYYLNSSDSELLASVTPMSANPPIGQPITSETKTYVIISKYDYVPNSSLFTYYGLGQNQLFPPISDNNLIISVGVNLASPIAGSNNKNQALDLVVSLRNRNTVQ